MIYRVIILFLCISLIPAASFAGASNNNPESKKEIKQIEHAQAVDQQMGIQEVTPPKPVKKPKNPDTADAQFQPRSGFQQQPLLVGRDQR